MTASGQYAVFGICTFLLLLSSAPFVCAQSDLILGDYDGDYANSDTIAAGVSATLAGGRDTVTDFGSTDASLGTILIAGVPAEGGTRRFRLDSGENVFTVTVANDSRQSIELTSLEFDYSRAFQDAPRVITVFYDGGDLGAATQLAAFTDDTPGDAASKISDYDDYSVDLAAGLGDTTLAQGEDATFSIVFSDSANSAISGALDNIGVFGTLGNLIATATVQADNPKWEISPLLAGMHQVYVTAPDALYADGSVAAWARRVGIGTSRYPGGSIVKYWDWENPTGTREGDPWDPAWNPANNEPPENWMSLDEYLDFVVQTGITPMFGVNSLSGVVHNRTQDGIDRAVRMVEYVKNRGFGGALWYIGNEEVAQHGGIVGYAKIFRRYAAAMKAADPTILIFWNDNEADAGRIALFLANDGGTSDGLESHGKWPYGGDPAGYAPGSYEQWLSEFPLRDRKDGNRAWRFAANKYRNAASAAGRPNYLVANNEWGLGKDINLTGFTRYTQGLMLTEFAMELAIGNWYSACFWDTVRGSETGLLDRANGNRVNPVGIGLNMLADAQRGQYLNVTTDINTVHGFAAAKSGAVFLYLINKSESSTDVQITLTGANYSEGRGRVMTESPDGYGQLGQLDVFGTGSNFSITLPALSFGEIVFADPTSVLTALPLQRNADDLLLSWQVLPAWEVRFESSVDLSSWQSAEIGILPDFTVLERWRSTTTDPRRFWRLALPLGE
jgi:hypothetical protein